MVRAHLPSPRTVPLPLLLRLLLLLFPGLALSNVAAQLAMRRKAASRLHRWHAMGGVGKEPAHRAFLPCNVPVFYYMQLTQGALSVHPELACFR